MEDVELGLVPPTPEVKLSNVFHATSPAPCTPAAALPFLTPVKPTREAKRTIDGSNEGVCPEGGCAALGQWLAQGVVLFLQKQ